MGLTSHTERQLVGFPKHVSVVDTEIDLREHASDLSGRVGAQPIAIARPSSTEDVQKIVQWAAKAKVPLIPVSSGGGPRRRGDTIADRASVILDLSAMRRIIHVDGEDALAIIEPGVTFEQLDKALAPHGLRSFRPLTARASKSVLATFLEREPMTVPGRHWDSADPLVAMEIIFGDGALFRTGGAALPGSFQENLARGNRPLNGIGPTHTDFGRVMQGAQGALGIVTWASIYCERLPAAEVPLFITADRLDRVVDVAYRLLRRRPGGQMFILNARQLALLFANDMAEFERTAKNLPAWILYFEVSAPDYFVDEAMAFQRADLERDAQRAGAQVATSLSGIAAADVRGRQGISTILPGAAAPVPYQEVFCLSQLDMLGTLLATLDPVEAEAACVYAQPVTHGVNAHCQLTLLGAPGEASSLKDRAVRVAQTLADGGGFFSRPYYPWAHIPFARDPSIQPLLARTKALFDPNAVLQPGAQSLGGAL